jgi:hypothetical protein
MPSARDCTERLREQAYRTLLPQIQDLEEELQNITGSLSTGIQQIERKLEALRRIELPTTELVLEEILGDVIRQKEQEKSDMALFSSNLRKKETQEEILGFLLESARRYSPLIALFAVRGDRFVGWSSRGFPESQAKDISAASFAFSECPQFWEAIEKESPTVAAVLPDQGPLEAIQRDAEAVSWHLFPLHAMQRPVALLLAGGTEEEPCTTDAVSILVDFTALHLENIALKILYSVASAPLEETAAPSAAEAVEPPPEEAPAREEAAEPISAPQESGFDMKVAEEPEPSSEEAPAPTAVEETPEVPETAQEEIPAPPSQPEAAESRPQEEAAVPEEEKLHSDAKRFARLLVSEIKLYNEHHVVEGRENRDLYLRLKRDIDRSREMYEKRVSPTVSRRIDYFHDEIIRILGDNDPSTLGSDYPGPRVDS